MKTESNSKKIGIRFQEKNTWRKLADFKLTSCLSNKIFLNVAFWAKFYENSAFFWYSFKHQKHFSYWKILKTIRKIQLYQICSISINFKMVSLESSLHCASDGKNRVRLCAHAQLELRLENARSKKYCVPDATCVGRRNWRHNLFNFWM